MKNDKFQRIWWQANISEEASVYPLITKLKNKYYLAPRIQLNRVKSTNIPLIEPKTETRYYHKSINYHYLSILKKDIPQLLKDEAEILSNFDINAKLYFSSIYISKKSNQTSRYSILINRLKDIEKYFDNISFELERHENQLKLFLNNRGGLSKGKISDIMIKFYKSVPIYLRGNKKIRENKFLSEGDKQGLLENVKTDICNDIRSCGYRENEFAG